MGDSDVSVESVEVALLSEIQMSSALMMKNAYLPHSGEKMDEEQDVPCSQPGGSCQEDGLAGPHALVSVTKLSSRTPPEEIEKILTRDPYRTTYVGTHDIYTLVLIISIRLGDPSTTRFINGTIDVAFLKGTKILAYSPKEKGIITAIIKNGRDAISLSQDLDFYASAAQGAKMQPDPQENRFGIPVGPEERITGTYSRKSGYSFDIPARVLLEYQGMPKNEHEMFWEIYPPMPPQDMESPGKEMLAVFSCIVQAPRNSPLKISTRIEGRVKGNLWGMVRINGSVVF